MPPLQEDKKTITSATFEPQEAMTLPNAPIEQPYDSNSIPPLEDLMAEEGPSATEQQGDQLDSRLLSSIDKLGGKQAAQYAAEDQYGVTNYRKQLTDLNSQLLSLQNEYKAIPLQTQQGAEGRGVTAAGLQPITTSKLRNNAIQALGLSSIGSVLQGNLALAEQQANRAVEIQYAPIENEINYLREAIQINEKRLGREDQKKAQKLQIQLADRERLLSNAREDKKLIYGWAAEAFKNGAPALLIQRAQALGNPDAALSMLGEYFVDKDAKAMALLDMDFKREQIKNAQYDRYIAGEDLKLRKEAMSMDWAKLQQEADKVAAETGGKADDAKNTRSDAIALINELLLADTSSIVGAANPFTARTPWNAKSRNQIDQLRNILALEARDKLKGSGAVSDYESRILTNSTTALGSGHFFSSTRLNEKEFSQELKKTRGVLNVMNGGTVNVKIQDPATGEIKSGPVNREGLNKAAERGYTIIYE